MAIINGSDNNDILYSTSAGDSLYGYNGDDIYYVNNSNVSIIESLNQGNDSIRSSVSFILPENAEKLYLLNSGNINGTGNNLNNYIKGNSGNNNLTGGTGNDTLDGGVGTDVLIGETGNDIYYIDNQNDTITEGLYQGYDTVYSSISYTLPDNVERIYLIAVGIKNATGNNLNNFINGNCFDNVLEGREGNDTIYGARANDTLDGGLGIDTMYGGTGDDIYYVDNSKDIIVEYTEQGTDEVISYITYTLPSKYNLENLTLLGNLDINGTGNWMDNNIIGNSGNNILNGMSGNDIIDGKEGLDKMYGSKGDDLFYVDNPNDEVIEYLDQGMDEIRTNISYSLSDNVENLTLTGSSSIDGTGNDLNNILIGNRSDNILNGGEGNDYIDGGAGRNRLIGEAGNDTFFFSRDLNQNSIIEADGSDSLKFSSETLQKHLIVYKDGNNLIIDFKDNSTDKITFIDWYSGNKVSTIQFGDGKTMTTAELENMISTPHGSFNGIIDVLTGTTGNDIYFIDNTNDKITENLYNGDDTVYSNTSYTLDNNVENIILIGANNLNATGNNLNNYMIGNSGNNILDGGSGNDVINGESGADILRGGIGDDTYFIDNTNDKIIENLSSGNDAAYSSISYTLDDNVEKLVLTGDNNTNATGNNLYNSVIGNSGNNTLDGGAGNDTIDGGDGDDIIKGGSGNDIMYGRAGDDIFDGGEGTNKMFGGEGNDIYFVDSTSDMPLEYSDQGIDEVRSSVSYTLSSTNLENLTLTGTGNISGTGNNINNEITGNSGNNIIDGGSGMDTIIGGSGNDILMGGRDSDIYTEFEAGFGVDTIKDYSGTEDYLNLGNFASSDTRITGLDINRDSRLDGIKISINSGESIDILNYFDNTNSHSYFCNAGSGFIEIIHFSDGDFDFAGIQSLLA